MMRKSTLLFLVLFIAFFGVKAQDSEQGGMGDFLPPDDFIDSIPEYDLKNGHINYLKTFYSECMIGDDLDPNCTKVKSQTKVIIPSKYQMDDLSWLKHFVNVRELEAMYNYISILPETFPVHLKKVNLYANNIDVVGGLPEGLEYLNISNQKQKITHLPALPDSLVDLYANSNNISVLPDTLPKKLMRLSLYSNKLTDLQNVVFPDTMEYVHLGYNSITSLPDKLPIRIVKELKLSGNNLGDLSKVKFPDYCGLVYLNNSQITALPEFGENISNLYLYGNSLGTLDNLPERLNYLDASDNEIENIVSFPQELLSVYLNQNKLKTLPELPENIGTIEIRNNQLTAFPEIPVSCRKLDVSGNSLTTLPALHEALSSLYVSKNLLSEISLPENLQDVDLSFNPLSKLPDFPFSLYKLTCESCGLNGEFVVPEGLRVLSVDNNAIEVLNTNNSNSLSRVSIANNNLSEFPYANSNSLFELNIKNNDINDLPVLGENISTLYASGNSIKCIKNLPHNLSKTDIKVICGYNCYIGKDGGSWDISENWSEGKVPGKGDNAFVLASSVKISTPASVKDLNLISSTLNASPSGDLSVHGSLKIKGYYDIDYSKINAPLKMAGATKQVVEIPSYYNYSIGELVIDNPEGVEFVDSYNWRIDKLDLNSLSILKGTLYTDTVQLGSFGRLGLITATNPFKGIKAVSYTSQVSKNWNFMGTVFRNQTFQNLKDGGVRVNITGSVISYKDDTDPQTIGWVKYSSLDQKFEPGVGYRIYGYEISTFRQAGIPYHGDMDFKVSFVEGGYEGGGWNFISNPYLSTIDWDENEGWEKVNVNDAVYVFDRSLQKYSSYVGGNATMGGSSKIAAGQSFFVRTNQNSPNLSPKLIVKETAKVGEVINLKNEVSENMKLKVSLQQENGRDKDELVLVIDENSSASFEGSRDAFKRVGSGANIYALSTEGKKLSINTFPIGSEDVIIPLGIESDINSSYKISFSEFDSFSDEYDVYLLDHEANSTEKIESGYTESINIAKGTTNRYSLLLRNSDVLGTEDPFKVSIAVFPNPFDDELTVKAEHGIDKVVVRNLVGGVCLNKLADGRTSFNVETSGLTSGIYLLEVYTMSGKETFKIIKN